MKRLKISLVTVLALLMFTLTSQAGIGISIELILDSSTKMNLDVVDRRDFSASGARSSTHPTTGYRDFNSEIFVYSGHSYRGYACYDGNSVFNYFGASELPSMSNCELAIWDCCEGDRKFVVRSLVSESLNKGAKTVIGWYESIGSGSAKNYMDKLFEELAKGLSVKQASDNSISRNNFQSTNVIVSSINLAGN